MSNVMSEKHFSVNPTNLNITRTRFNRGFNHKTTFNAGSLIPVFVDEVLPGDTFNLKLSSLVRTSTLLKPTMDNMFLDIYFFFVPNRLSWEHWKNFNGENTTDAWAPTTEYEIPQLTPPTGGFDFGTIAEKMGIVPKVDGNYSVNHLPFRAYVNIWNEWFRDQNLQKPAHHIITDAVTTGSNGGDIVTDAIKGGLPLPVNKVHDYFTSCLPEPQKGPAVTLALAGDAPVTGTIANTLVASGLTTGDYLQIPTGYTHGDSVEIFGFDGKTGHFADGSNASRVDLSIGVTGTVTSVPSLVADMSSISAFTINELRQSFQIQKLLERDARGGSRYVELLKEHFGVISPDARQQRPEYLGGKRIYLNITQVAQTSGSTADSPQANLSAFSQTSDSSGMFVKSFTEHGFVIGLVCVRTDHTYQQGTERFWSRKRRFDFFWPALANIGEQPVLNKEIFTAGTDADNEVFGFQEAWADYRYKPNRISGMFRSTFPQSLDVWHYGDDYSSLPHLDSSWIQETKVNIDRTLSVESSVADQFIADFEFDNVVTRPMPLYSIPGMIDHN